MNKTILLGALLACASIAIFSENAFAQRRGGGGGRGIGGGGSYGGGGYGGYSNQGYGGHNNGWGGIGYGGYGLGNSLHNGYYGNGYYNNGYHGNGNYNNGYSGSSYYPSNITYGTDTYNQGSYVDNGAGMSTGALVQQNAPSLSVPTGNQNQAFYSGPGQNNNSTRIQVILPTPDAQVWIDGQSTQQQGTQRLYLSPPLEQGAHYHYTLKASWNQNGQQVSREKRIDFDAGQQVMVNFNQANDSQTGSQNDTNRNEQIGNPSNSNTTNGNNPNSANRANSAIPNQQPRDNPQNPSR